MVKWIIKSTKISVPIDEYSEVQSEPVLSRAAKKEFGNAKQRLRDRFKKR